MTAKLPKRFKICKDFAAFFVYYEYLR